MKRSLLLSPTPQDRRGLEIWLESTTKRRWGHSWCSTWRGAPPSKRCQSGSTTWTARWSWPMVTPSHPCCSPTSATRRRRASTAKRSWTISAKRPASWAGLKHRPRWEIERRSSLRRSVGVLGDTWGDKSFEVFEVGWVERKEAVFLNDSFTFHKGSPVGKALLKGAIMAVTHRGLRNVRAHTWQHLFPLCFCCHSSLGMCCSLLFLWAPLRGEK